MREYKEQIKRAHKKSAYKERIQRAHKKSTYKEHIMRRAHNGFDRVRN